MKAHLSSFYLEIVAFNSANEPLWLLALRVIKTKVTFETFNSGLSCLVLTRSLIPKLAIQEFPKTVV